jgi:hypothetical protein
LIQETLGLRKTKTYLPELLAGILSTYTLEDLRSAGVLIDELGNVINLVVNDDPETILDSLVRSNVLGR